jgi:hypothetical protein
MHEGQVAGVFAAILLLWFLPNPVVLVHKWIKDFILRQIFRLITPDLSSLLIEMEHIKSFGPAIDDQGRIMEHCMSTHPIKGIMNFFRHGRLHDFL